MEESLYIAAEEFCPILMFRNAVSLTPDAIKDSF